MEQPQLRPCRSSPALLAKGRAEGDAEWPIWAVTESLVSQQGPASSHSPCPDRGPSVCLSGERHLRKGLVLLGAFPGMGRSIAVRNESLRTTKHPEDRL